MNPVYTRPKSSPKPTDYDEFFKSLTEQERQLLAIAEEKLGSSFFVQWCRLYLDWKSKKKV
jgi:hypothetical protein